MFLEFLSTLPPSEAATCSASRSIFITALGEKLAKRNSPYQGVFQALVSLSSEQPEREAVREILAQPDTDPDDLEALDAAWEDEAVQFGPGASASCKDEITRQGAGRQATGAGRANCRATSLSSSIQREARMRDAINYILFGWYPYLCLIVFLVGSWLRFDREQYTWRSGSSQLLRRKQLSWGSNLFHVGILVIFMGHFVGLLTPIWIFDMLGISHGAKQWLAIVAGGVAGVMCFVGITLLVHRRLFDPRIRRTSSFGDIAILLMLYAQLILGLCHHSAIARASRRPRDGQVHELGAGHPDAPARRRRAGRRCSHYLQAASSAWYDVIPGLSVHAPRSHLERADLVSRPPRLSGRAHAQRLAYGPRSGCQDLYRASQTPILRRKAAMSCSVHSITLPKPNRSR
jgi:hypothetical protein